MINWPVHGSEGRINPRQDNRDDERKHKLAKIKKEKKKKGGVKGVEVQYPALLMAIQFHTKAKQNKLHTRQLT